MKILTKGYERNQSSEERLFGILHRRQTGRPNINKDKILKELQIARFVKYPSIFKDLGYNNKEADNMLSSLSKQQTTVEQQSQEDSITPPEEQPIEEIIAQILFEREYEREDEEDDSQDESEDDEEDAAARYFIERSL